MCSTIDESGAVIAAAKCYVWYDWETMITTHCAIAYLYAYPVGIVIVWSKPFRLICISENVL